MDRREKALEARKKSGDNRTKESAPVVTPMMLLFVCFQLSFYQFLMVDFVIGDMF